MLLVWFKNSKLSELTLLGKTPGKPLELVVHIFVYPPPSQQYVFLFSDKVRG